MTNGLSDLSGPNDIDKVKVYFTKVLRLDFPSNTPEWGEIQNYKTLRNCIVHVQSRIDEMKTVEDRKKLKEYVAHNRTLSLGYQGEVNIDKGFCEEALATIERFLRMWLYPHDIQ